MMNSEKVKPHHLSRIAYVYIRQSTAYQVKNNPESRSRQYGLVDNAKALGFQDVRVIDEDLGLSSTQGSERSGFERLVAEVSMNRVGLVLGLEASRLARNNRDWYHLLDFCALFETLIADLDGIYSPRDPNDRMLLGLKGTISEVETNLMKGRMLEGARHKAKRGELIYRLPVGYEKTSQNQIEKHPNRRVQQIIAQVFAKFRECQSVRQTMLWFVQEGIDFPATEYGPFGKQVIWKRPVYNSVYHVLTNPTYAGAYVYGRHQRYSAVEGDKIIKRRRPVAMRDWQIVIKEHHPGYIDWDEFERNLALMSANAKQRGQAARGPVLKGNALLAGLLRCRRCGRKLDVAYGGKGGQMPRYECRRNRWMRGESDCLAFGGLRIDEAVGREVLKLVEPLAIEAAMQVIEAHDRADDEQRGLLELELQSAEYDARHAYHQYDQVDPENRLVCAQLEAKWNSCLQRCEQVREKLRQRPVKREPLSVVQREALLDLAEDLPALWNAESTSAEMRKRVVRTVIEEVICDVDKEKFRVVLDIHWAGGVHSRLSVKKNRPGEHRHCTDTSTEELIRQLSTQLPDKAMAPLLNRLKIKTGKGNTWTRDRVRSFRSDHHIPAYQGEQDERLTLEAAAQRLGVCAQSVRGLIATRVIAASQIITGAPWMIPVLELEKKEVIEAVERIKRRMNRKSPRCENQMDIFK
jgi:DNA invertase Pin-like site-specific DNA recombinase